MVALLMVTLYEVCVSPGPSQIGGFMGGEAGVENAISLLCRFVPLGGAIRASDYRLLININAL